MTPTSPQQIAVVGAGLAGIACARTLAQAGHRVHLFEKSRGVGGRMATRESPFGSFDHGAQYFTVRDPRLARALAVSPDICKPWSANAVRLLDAQGRVAAAGQTAREAHWVPGPGMNALARSWAQPLREAGQIELQTRVQRLERDALQPRRWQLQTQGADGSQRVFAGFDTVLLTLPAPQAAELLASADGMPESWLPRIRQVDMAPCWTLMLAFPQAMQPGLNALGPQWNAARSTHHRIAWLARESSKPGRGPVERWTVQASADWSREHLEDDPERVQGKLLRAFAEVTGIRAEPSHLDTQRWRYARTLRPLGRSHLWSARSRLGVAGDWCLGHRVENAFVSGLELALAAL